MSEPGAADIAPAAVKHLRSHADWLDRRRNDELWINDSGSGDAVVELRLSGMQRLITGLRDCADGLEYLASIIRHDLIRGATISIASTAAAESETPGSEDLGARRAENSTR